MLNIVIALCPCNCYALRESQVLVLLRSGWLACQRIFLIIRMGHVGSESQSVQYVPFDI